MERHWSDEIVVGGVTLRQAPRRRSRSPSTREEMCNLRLDLKTEREARRRLQLHLERVERRYDNLSFEKDQMDIRSRRDQEAYKALTETYQELMQRNQRVSTALEATLRRVTVAEGKKTNPDDSCSVCLLEINEETSSCLTRCGHAFHTSCMTQLMQTDEKCPLCRKSLL